MNAEGIAASAALRVRSGIARLGRAARALPPDRRLAAATALGLGLTLFLPWYQETGFASGKTLQTTSASLTGWHAFSWVEAAVLLVSISVLTLLFQRAEGRAFHLPGGDGSVVLVAGAWTCVLVIWRIFDKQGTTTSHQFGYTFGIKWGIFAALALACLLTYAGTRIRAAHMPEPPLPGEEPEADSRGRSAQEATARGSAAGRASARRAPTAVATPEVATGGAGGADSRAPRRGQRARRATWAEPITWEESRAGSQPGWAAEPDIPAERAIGKQPTHGVGPPVRQAPGRAVPLAAEDEATRVMQTDDDPTQPLGPPPTR